MIGTVSFSLPIVRGTMSPSTAVAVSPGTSVSCATPAIAVSSWTTRFTSSTGLSVVFRRSRRTSKYDSRQVIPATKVPSEVGALTGDVRRDADGSRGVGLDIAEWWGGVHRDVRVRGRLHDRS